jgi:hypothetical protein
LDIRITNNEFMAHAGTGAALDLTFTIAQYGYLNFSNNKLTYLGLKVTPKTASITGDINWNTVYLSGVNGIYMVSDATGYYLVLNMLSNNCYKNQRHGIFTASKVIALDVSGSRCRNNNQSAGSYDGLDIDLDDACTSFVARNLNCEDTQAAPTQRYGLNATGGASCVAKVFVNGVNCNGCTAGNVVSGAGLDWEEAKSLNTDVVLDTLTGDEVITIAKGNAIVRDGGTADRNLTTTSGTTAYPLGYILYIYNEGASHNLIFSRDTATATITPGTSAAFVFIGTATNRWRQLY